MSARLGRMTLQTLLRHYGITTIKELTHRTGLSRQHAWNLWHGQAGVGKETLKRLHTCLQIPLEALLQVDPVPARKPQARRPRRRPSDEGRQP